MLAGWFWLTFCSDKYLCKATDSETTMRVFQKSLIFITMITGFSAMLTNASFAQGAVKSSHGAWSMVCETPAVEVEVVRQACQIATKESLELIENNLVYQKAAVETMDANMLKKLDYEFHELICVAADCLPAFKTIAENKAHTDRVCTLELANKCGMAEVLEGHTNILNAIKQGDVDTAVQMTRVHLAHLDTILQEACEKHSDYFID